METSDAVALVVVVLLAAAHVASPLLTFVELVPRSWMLSAAGGVSVAYVFVHLMPEIADAQSAVEQNSSGFVAEFERHAYIAALVGVTVFYGLERAAVASQRQRAAQGDAVEDEPTSPGAFWVSVISFAVYNAIIGYLIVRRSEDDSNPAVALFAAAIGLHFVVNDLGLRDRHRRRYDRYGRPLLAAAILAGWVGGLAVEFSEPFVGLVVSFLAGGIILNAIKEELPSERQSRSFPFVTGAAVYAALLLVV